MAWRYNSKTGELTSPEGEPRGVGYAGTGVGRNDPSHEHVARVGPIPRGRYLIGKPYKHPHLGQVCMNLDPIGHDALGRSLFRIHGDNTKHDASLGCIILARKIREEIAASVDREIEVYS